jgi:hypothetical protein
MEILQSVPLEKEVLEKDPRIAGEIGVGKKRRNNLDWGLAPPLRPWHISGLITCINSRCQRSAAIM